MDDDNTTTTKEEDEQASTTPVYLVTFRSRKMAENAMRRGKAFEGHILTIDWDKSGTSNSSSYIPHTESDGFTPIDLGGLDDDDGQENEDDWKKRRRGGGNSDDEEESDEE